MKPIVLALLIAALAAPAASAAPFTPTIVNGDARGAAIRFDTSGDAIDAHDGEIKRFGNRYYLYGTSYGCGYVRLERPATPWCGYRVYSSPDLAHWTDEGPLFDATTSYWQSRCDSGTLSCYRPHVAYNAATRRYVLWMNSYDVANGYHVLTSTSPTGPFTEVALPQLAYPRGGDMDLFVDDDGTGYIAYTLTGAGYDEAVERLDPTYTTGTGDVTRLGLRNTEAPSLFSRHGTYYLTLSDPNCAYCDGTGASYLTAPTPLGPWKGAMRSDAPVVDGRLELTGRGALVKGGEQWRDYTLELSVTPRNTNGRYAQSGWFFRAADERNGYAWLIGNYPHPGAEGGNLTKVVYVNGQARVSIVKLPFAIVDGRTYRVRQEIAGTTLRTFIDGTLVDTTTDATYAAGTVGLRETTGESGAFDDVRVTAPDGTVLFQEDFSGDLSRWSGLEPRLRGFEFSPDSCGGQPADVAELPARGGHAYVFQSDRWNAGDQNEALATHYWEPLRFAADGSIAPLRCGAAFDVPLAGAHAGADTAPANLDQTSGSAGFRAFGDISGSLRRAQTFTAGRTGTLTRVAFTGYQDNHPNGPLVLQLAELDGDAPGRVLAQRSIPVSETRWSPSELVLDAGVPVVAGRRYAIVVSAPASTRRGYGFAYSDGDPYARGGALVSTDGGATWRPETGRDLKFETSVEDAR
jgi:hypothetical protein